MDEAVADAKRSMRAAMKRSLAAVSARDAAAWSRAVVEAIWDAPAFAAAGVVMVYAALPGEVDLQALADRALLMGKIVCWPRVNWEQQTMDAVAMERADWASAGLGVMGRFGIVEPGPDGIVISQRTLAARGLVLVPGLAFDEQGGRLGRGAGLYDRFLAPWRSERDRAAGSGLVLGVCFDQQMVGRVPMSSEDVAMEGIVSQRGLMLC